MEEMLQVDLALDIVAYLPLSSLANVIRASTCWRQALCHDGLWQSVVHRQWLVESPAVLGKRFSGGWREICEVFCALKKDDKWKCNLTEQHLQALGSLSRSAQHFIHGIVHGYMPTRDGCFTYHCQGATPIHYHHCMEENERPVHNSKHMLSVGGTWSLSPCRDAFFPSSTTLMTKGLFAQDNWRLAEDNEKIVCFLYLFPVIPLFKRSIAVDADAPVKSFEKLNSDCPDIDFRVALAAHCPRQRLPSLSCVKLDVYTVHMFFLPPLILACTESGWEVAPETTQLIRSGEVAEFQTLLSGLREQQGLSRHVRLCNLWLRDQLATQ